VLSEIADKIQATQTPPFQATFSKDGRQGFGLVDHHVMAECSQRPAYLP